MRLLPTLLTSAVLASVLGASAPALADDTHSMCVPGAPLHSPSTVGDPVIASIINSVCETPLLSACCDQGDGGRWSLECVQESAWTAKHIGLGDVCGRDAWAKGVIAGTPQRYPRDFSVLTLSGNLSGIPDSDGPIAAQGNISLSGFSLNGMLKKPVALVALGGLTLANGQITGRAHYGTYYRAPNTVTYLAATPPTAPSQPIDFVAATADLQTASGIIKNYTATPGSKASGTITFQASDPELNVFSIEASQLNGVSNYVFDVPQGSSVIVNVTGSTVTIQSAGFDRRNGLTPDRILWNLPDATRLRLSSISLPGSVLAPLADANLSSGSMQGTAVIKTSAGINSFALRGAPFEMPYVCSTPAFDPTIWNEDAGRLANNCYNYANNVFLTSYGAPGGASGETCPDTPHCSGAKIAKYAENDGLLPMTGTGSCPHSMTKVALFYQSFMDQGPHWWRLDSDYTWSDKYGNGEAKKQTGTPDEIDNFVGYFCTCSSRIQGHGRANIQ